MPRDTNGNYQPGEGDIIQTADSAAIFVVQGGLRHWIPNMATFYDNDFNAAAAIVLTRAEMDSIPSALQIPSSARFQLDLGSNLGAGHFMTTHGAMSTKTGQIRATTRTQSTTWMGGFRGGVMVLFEDGAGIALGASEMHTFGVDGTMIGTSDRTVFWSEAIPMDVVNRTAAVTLFHTWQPNAVRDQVQKAVDAGKPVQEVVSEVISKIKTVGSTGPTQ